MDRLILEGLQFYGHHGTEDWEQDVGRRFEVDVELHRNLGRPGRSDRLKQAMDYRRVYAIVAKVVEGETHQLIERIAWRILEELMSAYPVAAVTVRVTKPEAPIGGINAGAIIEITRTRDEFEAETEPED